MAVGVVCPPLCAPAPSKTNDWYASPCKCVTGEGGAPIGVPVLTSLTPNTAAATAGPTTITLAGSGFTEASTVVTQNGAIPTTYVSATELQATIDPAPPARTVQVAVENGVLVSAALPFTITIQA